MPDQNNAPERIWIKPCDPCENPYDYYVCDPRYLDGRETSYVKSIVSCAGCGGGLKRRSGQFVCRDCGKAETVQEVLTRADRAAPEGQVRALDVDDLAQIIRVVDGSNTKGAGELAEAILAALTPPPAAPTDNTALVDVLASLAAAISLLERGGKKAAPSDKMFEQMLIDYRASLERGRTAALASREAQQPAGEAMPVGCGKPCGYDCNGACFDPPACQQEAVTVAEAAAVLLGDPAAIKVLVNFQLRHSASASDKARSMRHVQVVAALRALKGES